MPSPRASGLFITVLLSSACPQAYAQQANCDTAAFREVVSNASAAITVLQQKNTKLVHEKLQRLRAAKNWSDSEYEANATPFVKDETTERLDTANEALLAKVRSLQESDAGSEAGRCAMLKEVTAAMVGLVANTAAKWDHMVAKLTKAETSSAQAEMSQ